MISNKKRRFAALLGLGLSVVLATATIGSGALERGKAEPIKIGTIMSITGAIAAVGIQQKNAMELAVRQVNAAGCINGRKIEWKVYDPALDTGKAVELTRRLVDSDGVQLGTLLRAARRRTVLDRRHASHAKPSSRDSSR